jgi:hypothetical protein
VTGATSRFGFRLKKEGNSCSTLFLNDTTLGLDQKQGNYQKGSTVRGVIYVDKCSVEAYIDDSITISGTNYLTGKDLELFMDGDAKCSVKVTEMQSIHD